MKRHVALSLALSLWWTLASTQVYVLDSANIPANPSAVARNMGSLNFLLLGDWGRNGADHQKEVAIQLGKTATEIGAQFIIAAGDNFYPSGVISEQDPLFHFSFENIYTDFSLQWDWYLVLGNHDYKSNPEAQVKYSGISRRWKMPARYYSKKFAINGDNTQQVLIAFIDTNPLIPQFYSNSEYGPNVITQDSTAQKMWLQNVLSDQDRNIKWKIVVGHHPMYTGGSRTEAYDTRAIRQSLQPILDQYKVDLYLSGHEHSLQHIEAKGGWHQFISGSASEKTPVKMIDGAHMVASEYGFMLFSLSGNQCRVQTIDYTGKVLYATTIDKKASP